MPQRFEINTMIEKILIANRGEIACRVIKTAKKMGIKTVAIYSSADENSLHKQLADEAYWVGEAPSSASYLNQDKIIEIAKASHADAIHPGYGFLSENAQFARRLKGENIILLGPSPEAMEMMGSKLAAKDAVKSYDIPLIPGTDQALKNIDEAIEVIDSIGLPILIKASAGGGGKGMRVVDNRADLEDQVKMAMSEAKSAFGDSSVFIEKYITSPRHIEIQILADNYGNIVYLNERECSIQRRHQKVVEEAPSAVVDADLRRKMGEAAVNVARSAKYTGVGTVEFLLDENKNFYFLEMNTRLQVEHPVTEMTTGLDLVEEQIRVANGEKLRLKQEDIKLKGHAIELRVYAEDPLDNFMPSINKLERYRLVTNNPNVRLDNGILEGMDVPINYDPMLSKLVVYGKDRMEAIELMKEAIANFEIKGIASTLEFGTFVMNHPAFISGDFDTNFVKYYFSKEGLQKMFSEEFDIATDFASYLYQKELDKV